MDNYNGQNQFGQNQMNQNQYVQPQYGQYQQVPQMQYQQVPQMQYQQVPQMQYQQMPQNMQYAQQQMYQQPQSYGNGYNGQVNNAKPKKKWLKWTLAIGIPVAIAAVVAIIFLFVIPAVNTKYNIKDVNEVKKICKNILDENIKKVKLTDQQKNAYAMKNMYATDDGLYSNVQWCEFESKEDAKVYFDYMKHYYLDEKEYINSYYGPEGKVKIKDNLVEAYGFYEIAIVLQDEYCVFIRIQGDDSEARLEEFVKKITK